MIWPARSAIRPAPRYAVVPQGVVSSVESEFAGSDRLEQRIDRAFDELDEDQPTLARFLSGQLDGVRDETAQALGHFLGVAVHRAFRSAFGERLRAVERDTLDAAAAAFECDEELRRGTAEEALETDDVVAMSQPHVVHFVREQIDAAMEADLEGEPSEIDVESVSQVYRAVLIAVLALGECVRPPQGSAAVGMVM